MSGWGIGYVTDVTYMPGYYRQQSPALLAIAGLLGGVAAPLPGPDDEVHYLELACGQGYGALVLAASNPRWRVTAVDFNPAHVAAARDWAARAGITNIQFIEADLSTLAGSAQAAAIPAADFASAHGLWSWVAPAVQAGLVRLLRDKLRPGAMLHLSYNAMPGWAGAIALQRVVREAGRRLAWRSDRRVQEGIRLANDLNTAEATHFRREHLAQGLLKRLGEMPVEYLAHEYMNDSWAPCWHADVCDALAGAKLDWVASATLQENFPELTLTDAQRDIVNRFDDPLMRELIRDLCMERTLRHDVFVRGARRVEIPARDAALRELALVATLSADELPAEVTMPAGRATLTPGFYGPIMRALAEGPARVRDLLELPDVEGKRDNPAELVGVLVGLGYAEPMLRPGAATAGPAQALSRLLAGGPIRPERLNRPTAIASHAQGGGVATNYLEVFVLDRVLAGEGEEAVGNWVRSFEPANAETRDKLHGALERVLRRRIPLMRAAGVL